MNKAVNIYTAVIQTVILVSLYVSAAFITFEFIYLGLIGSLSIEAILKSFIISCIFILLSFVIKIKYPTRFVRSNLNKILGFILAGALSIYTIQVIDSSFQAQYIYASKLFESNLAISMLRDVAFYGMGVFFLIGIPIIFLMSWLDQKKGMRLVNYVLAIVCSGIIIFMIDSFEREGVAKTFLLQGLKPLTIFIIGSLSFGWIRELFIRSMEK